MSPLKLNRWLTAVIEYHDLTKNTTLNFRLVSFETNHAGLPPSPLTQIPASLAGPNDSKPSARGRPGVALSTTDKVTGGSH